MKNKIIAIAKAEVGKYKEGSNNENPYSRDMDKKYWQFFNGKKAPGTAYCAIGICWVFCEYFGDKDKALKFLGCPAPANNAAAGCKYLHQYLKKNGDEVARTDGKAGDIVFFRNDAHVGLIEKIANGYYHTIEWNKGGKSSDCVARGKYKIGSSSITGIVRPAYPIEQEQPVSSYQFPKIPARGFFGNGDREPYCEVKKMQKILLAIKPDCLPRFGCDGIVGQETLAGVAAVQRVVGTTVDRLYGPKTNEACRKYLTK